MAARLRRAAAGSSAAAPFRVAESASWAEAHRLALAARPDLVVFDPYASSSAAAGECGAFCASFPGVPLLAYGDFDGRRARDLLALGVAGVRDVVLRGQDDDPRSFRRRLEEVLSRDAADDTLAVVDDLLPPSVRPLFHRLLLHARAGLAPDAVARQEHCHPKTLRVRLRAAGLPSLNRLIVWARLIHTSQLLARSERSIERTALEAGFPSAAALRTQLRRYTGMAPHELRGHDGADRLLERFRAECRASGRPHAAGAGNGRA